MRLLSLTLDRFRNHAATRIDFSQEQTTVLLGENGSGKTNIIEAISLLSLAKSCRDGDDATMVEWGECSYRLRADVCSDEDEARRRVELVAECSPRRLRGAFLNDVRVPQAQLIGALPTVIFLPEDLSLLQGPPAGRRRFLDRLLCQVSPEYLRVLGQYQRFLKQRNTLLKHVAAGRQPEETLDVWDRQLADSGAALTLMRASLLGTFTMALGEEIRLLDLPWGDASLVYDRSGTETQQTELAEEVFALLRTRRQRDRLLLSTSVGPHRDDWRVHADGRPIAQFASRGQERLAFLALLFLSVSYLELQRGEKPVILLDDVYSELDDKHRDALAHALRGCQAILTATHLPPESDGMQVLHVREGSVQTADRSAVDVP